MSAAQATLPLEFARPARVAHEGADAHDTGFEIGWDHARHRLVPPASQLHAGSPVRQGFEAGRAAFGPRTRKATPHLRTWLQLRLGAWQRGHAFCTLQVTPALLRRIEVAVCPIVREPLLHGTGGPLDASVERVNEAAGYAAGNLAVMSARASAAKASHAWDDAMSFARRVEAGQPGTIEGLDAAQWTRLGVLLSYTTPLPHAVAAALPMRLLPPPRLRLLNPVQCLQALLTLQFTHEACSPRIAALADLMPCPATRDALRGFMHTLLARRIAARCSGDTLRRTLEDLWADPLVLRRWQRLALGLSEAACEQLVQEAMQRGLAGPQFHWLPFELATEAWALASRGCVGSVPLAA